MNRAYRRIKLKEQRRKLRRKFREDKRLSEIHSNFWTDFTEYVQKKILRRG